MDLSAFSQTHDGPSGIPKLPMCKDQVRDGGVPILPKQVPLPPPRQHVSEDEAEIEPLGDPVEVIGHAYDMKVEDDFQGRTEIHMWLLDQKSNPILARAPDVPIFAHIELPQFVEGRLVRWDNGSAGYVVEKLAEMLRDDAPTKWAFALKPKLYYYREDRKFPMIMVMFKTLRAMYHCQNLVAKPRRYGDFGTLKLDMWETSISIIRKLFSLRQCRYSQWFRIQGKEVPINHELRACTTGAGYSEESKDTSIIKEAERHIASSIPQVPLREYIVEWKTLTAIPPEESKGWTTQPRLLAFDIETYSDNHRAMPNEFNALHVAYMISCVYQRLGDPNSRRRFAIIMGDCNDIPGCEVIRVNSEIEEVEAMAMLVRTLDPEIVTGYNILAYDYPYLDRRIKTKMCDWPQMGRIEGRIPTMTTKAWKSSAYGHNSINILQMDGRISIDMLPIILG